MMLNGTSSSIEGSITPEGLMAYLAVLCVLAVAVIAVVVAVHRRIRR